MFKKTRANISPHGIKDKIYSFSARHFCGLIQIHVFSRQRVVNAPPSRRSTIIIEYSVKLTVYTAVLLVQMRFAIRF